MAEAIDQRGWGRIALVTCPLIVLLGSASGWLSNSGYGNAWFAGLQKPFFMPPGWLFGLVWPILYLLMGIALAMILALRPSRERRSALVLFFVQLALNFAWSPIFFAAHDVTLAKWLIFVLTAIAALAAGRFMRLRKPAGLLLIPYLAWLVFAASLNSAIDALNPGAGSSLLS
jgi:tryptophan-rich sensory protein